MAFAPQFAGPHDPVTETPVRHAGSVRRTTTIDTVRPGDLYGDLVVDARGRDLVTEPDGSTAVIREARIAIGLDPTRTITSIEAVASSADPSPLPVLGSLVGASTSGGFRKLVRAALPELEPGTLWHLLLDDLVGAMIVAGVAQQHAEAMAGGGPMSQSLRANIDALFESQANICAGWIEDGVMLTELRRSGELPAVQGPPAPPLERSDDPWAWHDAPPLPPHGMRRRRRLDLRSASPGGIAAFDAHFRDSHVDGGGHETSVHEYTMRGTIDVDRRCIAAVDADARVLPWQECPNALASVHRARGVRLDALRDRVRTDFTGVTTCTHLNDMLRSLADLDTLLGR
jgi:hypothetical protein